VGSLSHYVLQVVEAREEEAPYLLPDFAYNRSNRPHSYPKSLVMKEGWLFHQ